MPDEGQIIRGINWRQTFPFTNIFRGFRVAIHPSKLVLGLVLLLTVYFGGLILDGLWPSRMRAVPDEIKYFQDSIWPSGEMTDLSPNSFVERRDQRRQWIQQNYAQMLLDYKVFTPPATGTDTSADDAKKAAQNRDKLSDLKQKFLEELSQAKQQADADLTKAKQDNLAAYNKNNSTPNAPQIQKDADDAAQKVHDDAYLAAYSHANDQIFLADEIDGNGLFSTFFTYEVSQITSVVDAVTHNEWLEHGGVVTHLKYFFTVGPLWLARYHTVFFLLFAVLFLLAFSLFGGAISRIAAVHVARDEKISVRQAMNFAAGKVLSFASAPVIPIAIVLVIGLLLSGASLVGNIPYVGPIVIGGFFIFALIAGFVMTLVLLGTAGGFGLMYPTVAVEGSDSFDAISRSFSYVYARPWRMLFYVSVAILYGAATYFFVHMFIWLILSLTHFFVGLGMFAHAPNTAELLPIIWPSPANRLSYAIDYTSLNGWQAIGAFLIHVWVMLLVCILGAFAISLYFSINTIIYFLMRSEVDATETDEVYLEQSEDEFTPAPAAAVIIQTTETVTPAATTEPPASPAV